MRSAGDAGGGGQVGVRLQVPPLAVHRHDVARLDDVVAVEELAGAGVAGDVHHRVALVHDLGAPAGEPVDDPVDRVLVARGSATRPSGRCRPRRRGSGGRGWPSATAPPSARPASRCRSAPPAGRAGRRSAWGRPPGRRARAGSRARGRCPCCAPSTGRRTATLRPCLLAASRTCWMRCTWLAKLATMTRRCAVAKTRSIAGAMSRSGVVKPGTSALVESTRNRSTPSSPSRAKARRSVMRPSSGIWSILKSPVCRTSPAGVRIATASASGIEWLTATNSQSNGPSCSRPPSRTSRV